ncbi:MULTISPECIES: hypothetical protein [Pseudomonas]|uniref:Uncharacterized protein n=1 Tax=Pseudomonas fluorescens TaxID=294 RepID=A0A166MTK4_PSEFL|nr:MULTISPECIES: hypothetical protein [Pseudomonas]KZN16195.1 hypothetical protein A1D17_08505 [Pseudomonas fluorescens]
MNDEEMAREIAKSAQAFSEPIDFDKLIKDGLLIKEGRSFYVPDFNALPEKVSKRIKETASTKDGLRVTFHKESKALKKIAEQLSGYLE